MFARDLWKKETGRKSEWQSFGEPGDMYYLEILDPEYVKWLEEKVFQAQAQGKEGKA